MCGFAGYFSIKHRVDLSTIRRMMSLQKHRGPDDTGYAMISFQQEKLESLSERGCLPTLSGDLAFGFNRLSIIDLSENGHQPMISQNGSVALMMNGEIYNAVDYRAILSAEGYHFKSKTDTEVALALYVKFGIDGMLSRLNGMFAFAIYDAKLKTLFLARDRFGIKPLYVLNQPDQLAFSSELKSFFALPDFSFELDGENLDEFLLFRNLINRTLYRNIVKVEPGEYYAIGMDRRIRKKKYYELDLEGQPVDGTNCEKRLEDSLRASVQRQMISDVKLGCQLSGGVDSSLVTCFAKDFLSSGNLETISIVPDAKEFSEEAYIDEVQKRLGIVSHKYLLDSEYYLNNLEKAVWHFEKPLNHPNTIGIYQLSQFAKRHVTVLLSGEGADEVLAGYPRFLDTLRSPFMSRAFYGRLYRNGASSLEYMLSLLRPNMSIMLGSSYTSFDIIRRIKANFSVDSAIAFRNSLLTGFTGDKLLRHRKYEIATYLPDLLMRQDKMSMAHSIENRVPYLDNEFVSIALRVPTEALLRDDKELHEKNVLKKIAAKYFSRGFAYRTKQGFPIPLRKFFQSSDFQGKWNDEWLPRMQRRGIFLTKSLASWCRDLERLKPAQLDMIWLMVGFEIWANQYIDREFGAISA